MASSTALRLGLAFPLLLVLAACGDCGGTGGDAGPDGGGEVGEDGGDQCEFIGGDCASSADCCGDLICGTGDVCSEAPGCENNDSFAGTPGAPADLEGLGADTPLACSGFPFLDVFSIDATAGELLRITLQTAGIAPNTELAQGQSDIDIYLLNGPPTGISTANGGNEVQGPIVDVGATVLSTENILYEVPTSGTYYLAVTVWSGPDAEYSLDVSRGQSCDFDADCAGGEFCRVGVDPNVLVVVQECATWTAPGCGAGADEAGGDVHSDSSAVALTGAATGLSCSGDIDVFSFEKALLERALIELSSDDLGADDALVATVVDAAGEILTVFVLEPDAGSAEYSLGVGTPAGTYYLYLEQFGTGTGEASYDVSVDLQPACRTDADCSGGRTCGQEIFGGGPTQVCVVANDTCSDADSDNSRTSATALVEGTDASSAVCMGGWDIYEIDLDQPANDVTVSLTWAGTADLDLYVFAEDGTGLGAGWYGANGEEWQGVALTAQKLYAWVSAFACDFDAQGNPVQCPDQQSYTLSVEINAATVCDEDADCFVGGTTANDPTNTYTCTSVTVPGGSAEDAGVGDDDGGVLDGGDGDGGETSPDPVDAGSGGDVTLQACVRPTPAALLTKEGGEACYDTLDCSTLVCIDSYCSSDCAEQADCDATLGAGNGYCFELSDPPVCQLPCAADTDCDRVWGADNNLSCTAGECVLP